MKDEFRLISGVVAVGIYLCLVAVVLYYFNYRSSEKAVHYVKKNSHVMAVSLASGNQLKRKEKKQSSQKKVREKPKKIRNITSVNKRKQKSKKAKNPPKKVKAKSLFSSVKTPADEALIAYLKQLQEIGLGSHRNPKPYQIEVSFEATE